MRNLAIILILSIAVTACRTSKVPEPITIVKDSVVTKETIRVVRDTSFLPGDTVEFYLQLPCLDVAIDTSVKKGNTRLAVTINNGVLHADCMTDSLLHVIDSVSRELETEKYKNVTSVITKLVPEIKYRVPKWCWYLLALNIAYLAFKFRSPISSLIKKLLT